MNKITCFRVGDAIFPTLALATAHATRTHQTVEVLFRGVWMAVAEAVAKLATVQA